MPYIRRDNNGKITAILGKQEKDVEEEISASNPELTEFLKEQGDSSMSLQFLSSSDEDLVRVIEDVIDLLIKKNIILLTDLPTEAQDKLIHRKKARATLNTATALMIEKDDIL